MTPEQFGSFLATTIIPMVIGLWFANKFWKDMGISRRAKKEGLTYKEMKEKIKDEKEI